MISKNVEMTLWLQELLSLFIGREIRMSCARADPAKVHLDVEGLSHNHVVLLICER